MSLWSRFRSLHLGWQITIGAVLISFWPLLFIALPVFAYYGLKQKPRAYRLGVVVVALLPIVVFAGVMSERSNDANDIRRQLDEMDRQQHGTDLLAQKSAPSGATQSSTPAAVPAKAETPYERIVSIVDKYGEYPMISNLDDINARHPQPPYEVIVAMTAKSCFNAKEKAQQIMRDLYLDPALSNALIRVKVIDPRFVSASLGATDAKRVHETLWSGGPSNFHKALAEVASYDRDMTEGEATSRTAPTYTYAEFQGDCQ